MPLASSARGIPCGTRCPSCPCSHRQPAYAVGQLNLAWTTRRSRPLGRHIAVLSLLAVVSAANAQLTINVTLGDHTGVTNPTTTDLAQAVIEKAVVECAVQSYGASQVRVCSARRNRADAFPMK
jgi:hypothetical protein